MTDSLIPDDLPQSKRHIWWVVFIVIGICCVCYVLNLYVTAITENAGTSVWLKRNLAIIKNVLENFMAGAIAALALALTYRSVIQIFNSGDRAVEIAPQGITRRLLKNAKHTRNYIFIGNTATFVSSAVLPELMDAAVRPNGTARTLRLYLLDPTDPSSVNSYVTFKERVSLANERKKKLLFAVWRKNKTRDIESHDGVKAKILAAVYLCAHASLHQGLSVTVYLRKSFTPFRADISDTEAVLTQETESEAAIAFSSQGHFYRWYQKDADAQEDQSYKIDLDGQRAALAKFALVGPRASKEKIKDSIGKFLSANPYLKSLTDSAIAIDLAVDRVHEPSHEY